LRMTSSENREKSVISSEIVKIFKMGRAKIRKDVHGTRTVDLDSLIEL